MTDVRQGEAPAPDIPRTPEERAAKVRDMSPADLVAGPGALPDAPMPMPEQVIEPARSLIARLAASLRILPRLPAAPSAGNGL